MNAKMMKTVDPKSWFDGVIYKLHVPGKGWRALQLKVTSKDEDRISGSCQVVYPAMTAFKEEKFWYWRREDGCFRIFSSPTLNAAPLMTLHPESIAYEWAGKTTDGKPACWKMHHGEYVARLVNDLEQAGVNGKVQGAELGVHQGFMSRVLLDRIPRLELHMVDLWGVHPADSEFVKSGDLRSKHDWKTYNDNLLLARRRVRKYTWNAHVHITSTHLAAELFADESLDFVFIDGDHSFFGCHQDMVDWLPKIRKGGLFSGHDYNYHPEGMDIQVTQAVDTFMEENGLPKAKVGPSCVWWMVKK